MKNFLIALLFLFAAACGSKKQYNEAELEAAYKVQQDILEALPIVKGELNISTLSAKDSLYDAIHELEESLFEIPGYHLELPGHEGHDHSHQRVELTAKEMVDVNSLP